jgi:hypothetical protein
MLKNISKYEERYFKGKINFSPVHPALLLDDSAGRVTRGLWWTN